MLSLSLGLFLPLSVFQRFDVVLLQQSAQYIDSLELLALVRRSSLREGAIIISGRVHPRRQQDRGRAETGVG